MSIEFRTDDKVADWYHVLVDDVKKGAIHRDGVIWRLTLWLNHREIDKAQGYGSLETAQRHAREHYEGCMQFDELIGG